MATTGEVFPAAAETAAESPWLDNDWTAPTDALTDNATYASITDATYDDTDQSFVLKLYTYDFSSITAGSTIDGVIVRVNAYRGAAAASIGLCQLLDAAMAKVGDNKAATPSALTVTTTDVYTYGSSTDLWGNALTLAWVQDADFGCALGTVADANNVDVFVDYASIEVFYTEPLGPALPPPSTVRACGVGF